MNKQVITPTFETVFASGLPNSYIIGITDQSKELESEILEFLDRKDLNEKILLEDTTLTVDNDDKQYVFNLKDHLKPFLSEVREDEFYIVFGFLNEKNEPRNNEMKAIKFELNREVQ